MNGGNSLEIETIQDIIINSDMAVKVTTTGNIIEIMYKEKSSIGNNIKKLNANEYIDISTGEIKEYKHTDNRSQSKNELRKTFKKIRDIINCNVDKPNNCKWVTLTYAENMTDTKRLCKDVEKYIKRLRYKYGKFEFIQVAEPQGRGAWHIHMIMIFDRKAPYIDNKDMQDIWGYGFTNTRKLDDIDNLGAYLSAYLGDVSFDEINNDFALIQKCLGKEVKQVDDKYYIKGGRLHLYPTGFNIYRCSRGVKRPVVEKMFEEQARKKVSAATLTFQKTINIKDGDEFSNTINYRYYNIKKCNDK